MNLRENLTRSGLWLVVVFWLASSVSAEPQVHLYPVIAFDEPYTHQGSQRNLLGDDADPTLVASLSNEKQVTAETPPTFLWHTAEDRAVPAENSVFYWLALRKAKVPCELHIFQTGRHGLGLARSTPGTCRWPALCRTWLEQQARLATDTASR
jgi:acetyl esterase/lipase